MNVRLTIFTATYNRKELLARLHSSLCSQKSDQFEWVIVDDGSNDGTEELVNSWIRAAQFPIIYHLQDNLGKPTAYNRGIELASGQYFSNVDSDDYIPEGSINNIIALMSNLDSEPDICGISALCSRRSGEIVGLPYPEGLAKGPASLGGALAKGDKKKVFKTSVIRNFPFPIIPGEKFITESVVYNRISRSGYNFKFVNEIIHIIEYQETGLSSNPVRLRLNNINGTILYYEEAIHFSDDPSLRNSSNLFRYLIHRDGIYCIFRSVLSFAGRRRSPLFAAVSRALGLALFVSDILRGNRARPVSEI